MSNCDRNLEKICNTDHPSGQASALTRFQDLRAEWAAESHGYDGSI